MSTRELEQPDLTASIRAALSAADLPSQLLCVEVPESILSFKPAEPLTPRAA